LGAGATPTSVDLPRMLRVAAWIGSPPPGQETTAEKIKEARADPRPRPGELPVPRYPFEVDNALAELGKGVFERHCYSCHGWQGREVGTVDPLERVGTDPHRLRSFTSAFNSQQNSLGAGQPWRFHHFRRTNGYANQPLDGLWARAPYLHNGSVPTLEDLLEVSRPPGFYRGDDRYDTKKVGFRSDKDRDADGRRLFWFDTKLPGNGNGGHRYGTDLPREQKRQLLEYLKTL
jgi:hypothetical protein